MGQELEEQWTVQVVAEAERQIERRWLVVVSVSVAGKLCIHQRAGASGSRMQRGILVNWWSRWHSGQLGGGRREGVMLVFQFGS
jgi:membrane-bound inhibitor of C-type lysozyme